VVDGLHHSLEHGVEDAARVFEVSSRAALDDAVRVLDRHGVPHSEIRDLGEAFGICILIFRDPDNVQLELSGPRG
jgi:hypothetical protein